MKEFSAIRKAALAKRDAAIKRARDEYASTLKRIAALEQDILGRDPSDHKTISSAVNTLIPTDRTFTTVDIMAGLEALDPGRVWRKRSVDCHISRLRDKGLVRRIKKASGTEPAVYARTEVPTEPLPFEDMTLADVAEAVLRDGPLTQTELVVTMLESGYQTTMGQKALRDAVGVVLRGDQERFRSEGRKWMCC